MNEQDHYIRRMNQHNEDLRRRNGELYRALEKADPDAAAKLTPLADYPTRYCRIDKIISTLGMVYENDLNLADAIERLYDHYAELESYWLNVEAERARRAERAAAAKATREARKLVEGA